MRAKGVLIKWQSPMIPHALKRRMEIHSEHLISMHIQRHTILVDMGDTYEMDESICLMNAWKASYLGGDKIKLRNAKRVRHFVRTYIHLYLIIVISNYQLICHSKFIICLTLSDPKSMGAAHTLSIIQIIMTMIIFMTNMQINRLWYIIYAICH